MKIIVLLILIFVCYLLFSDQIVENVDNTINRNTEVEILDKYDNYYSGNNCCIISKNIIPNNYMAYEYAISKDCPRNYSNNYRAIFSDELVNDQKLDMSKCNSDSNLFGSCRKIGGFECIDFVTKKDCDKIKPLIWSKESCNTPITKGPNNSSQVTYPEWEIAINENNRKIKSEIDYPE
jgi:hypothetical protein